MRDSWKKIQFESLGYTFGGLTNKTKDDFGKGKPYIPYLNIFENSRIDSDFLEYVQVRSNERQNKVQNGDLFFTTSSETPHEVGMTSVLLKDLGEAYLNSFCFGFRLHNFEDLNPEFASYLFRGKDVRKSISDLAQGSTRYNLSKSILFDKLYLNLPPIPQQQKIAKILSTCDSVIEQTEKAIAKYQAIKQGMLQDLFTRGIDIKTGKLRPKLEDAPELYKESELGMIPIDWECSQLDNFVSINMGQSPSSSAYNDQMIGLPLIQGNADIENGVTKPKLFTSQITKRAEIGDIIMTVRAPVGDIATANVNCCIGRGVCSLNSNINEFLLNLLIFKRSKWKRIEQGTTFTAISRSDIESFLLAIPEKEAERLLIQERLESINSKLHTEQATLNKYYQIKSGLMQDLLSGKVEVLVSEEEKITSK